MKRNNFLPSLLVLFPPPFHHFAADEEAGPEKAKGLIIPAGKGRLHGHITLKGVNSNIIDVKVSGKDTNGELAIFEQTSISQGRGTPLHLHHFQDEIFYVINGSYRFKVGEDIHELSTGDSIFLPRKIPHAWIQVSKKGKMNVIVQPAGKMEDFFLSMAALDHEPTGQEVAEMFSNHGMQVVGPPLQLG